LSGAFPREVYATDRRNGAATAVVKIYLRVTDEAFEWRRIRQCPEGVFDIER